MIFDLIFWSKFHFYTKIASPGPPFRAPIYYISKVWYLSFHWKKNYVCTYLRSNFTFSIAPPMKKCRFFDEYCWKSDPKMECRIVFCPFFGSALHNKLQLAIFIILTSFLIPSKAQVNPSMILYQKIKWGPNWGPYKDQNAIIELRIFAYFQPKYSILILIRPPIRVPN